MSKKLPELIQKKYTLFQLKNAECYANDDGSWRLAFDMDKKTLADLRDKRQIVILQTDRGLFRATCTHRSTT